MDVIEHLRSRARLTGNSFAEIERMYLLEGLARRIFAQPDAEEVVLRGSLATSLWLKPFPRPIQDIDLMTGQKDPVEWGMEFLTRSLNTNIPLDEIEVGVDGITFQTTFVDTSPGLKASIPCKIGTSKTDIEIDLAGGDTLTLPPVWMNFPSLRPDADFQIYTVVPEQAVAWKMHGPFEFWDTSGTWRMKDFFDLVMIFRQVEMDSEKVKMTLVQAFRDKGTPPQVCQRFVEGEFGKSKGSRRAWKNFVDSLGEASTIASLEELLEKAMVFLKPFYIDLMGSHLDDLGSLSEGEK
jgi:hypothetical protein